MIVVGDEVTLMDGVGGRVTAIDDEEVATVRFSEPSGRDWSVNIETSQLVLRTVL